MAIATVKTTVRYRAPFDKESNPLIVNISEMIKKPITIMVNKNTSHFFVGCTCRDSIYIFYV